VTHTAAVFETDSKIVRAIWMALRCRKFKIARGERQIRSHYDSALEEDAETVLS
jgi:hypothetical protein